MDDGAGGRWCMQTPRTTLALAGDGALQELVNVIQLNISTDILTD